MENSNSERRQYKRVSFREPVQYHSHNGYGGCLAADISEGGIRVNLNNFIPLNTEIAFQIFLSPTKVVKCVGNVVWAQKYPFSDRYQAGLRFHDTDSSPESRKELRQYIETH